MKHKLEKVVVVGGGTAGWLSALFLNKKFNEQNSRTGEVTLIESADVGIIGVGESTVPTLRETFQALGLCEDECMIRCNATFKVAIKFVNWSGRPGNQVFWHPFTPLLPSFYGNQIAHAWLKRKLLGNMEPFDRSCYVAVPLCEQKRAPRADNAPPYHGVVNYAYHVDAGLLAAHLRDKAKARGVKHIVDHVSNVILDERGDITHLQTSQGVSLDADLFIDCTGFRGLLINEVLKEPFLSYADSLFCDSAVIALGVPHRTEEHGLNPYTTATALSSGWVWEIPTYTRKGVGYVYSSSFLSREAAEEEFRKYLGVNTDRYATRHIRMRVGRTRNAWVKNCVSIGLSTGFVEPLESTGILLIEIGLRHLGTNFPSVNLDENHRRENYNLVMQQYYEHIRDFLVLHYCTTRRDDTPFWRENQHHPVIPSSLQHKLQLWKFKVPSAEDIEPIFFRDYSYMCILAGMDYLPEKIQPFTGYGHRADADKEFSAIGDQARRLMSILPDHFDYLRRKRYLKG